MTKTEARICGCGLLPLTYETSLVPEVLEEWIKLLLKADSYSYSHLQES